MKNLIDIKHLILITLAFVLFTAIGTVSHEMGHIVVAESLGYETTLRYGSMNYKNSNLDKRISKIYSKNQTAIVKGFDFKQKNEYEKGVKKLQSNNLLIAIGGPLQTTLTGTIGLLILLFRRNKSVGYELQLIDWLSIFLSLFWLREVFNLVMSIGGELLSPNDSYFGGDEKNISEMLNLWEGTFSIVLGFIGLGVSIYVVFRVVPKYLRVTFILGGLIGGILGFILWMDIVGPMVLP